MTDEHAELLRQILAQQKEQFAYVQQQHQLAEKRHLVFLKGMKMVLYGGVLLLGVVLTLIVIFVSHG
ncbi:MAG TPA: hypothetical protein VGN12_24205 [Pirellulales bacterium]|jgi:hypothetical protein